MKLFADTENAQKVQHISDNTYLSGPEFYNPVNIGQNQILF